MLLPRFVLCACLAFVGLAAAPALRAEPATAPPSAAGEAAVVLVGAAGRDAQLKALLRELLERRGVVARLSGRNTFGREQLLRAAASGREVLVFVVPGSAGNVGLYFRAPDGERFLLRSVLLRSGFDDVGRELVGQVVETAVWSLLSSRDGLTREQARVALASSDSPPAVPDPPPRVGPLKRAVAAPTQPASAGGAQATTALEGWFALRYGALALGTLGLAHGPGVELGLGVNGGLLLRGRLTFERDFPQSHTTSRIAAEFTRVRSRFALDAGVPLASQHTLLISLGVGQDWIGVKPAAAPGSSVTPAPAFENRAPVAQAELRHETTFGRFRLAAALGADASLVETHYDVAYGTERQSVVRPWLIRPSASLALAFCPRAATF
jgi:hypothetical protein